MQTTVMMPLSWTKHPAAERGAIEGAWSALPGSSTRGFMAGVKPGQTTGLLSRRRPPMPLATPSRSRPPRRSCPARRRRPRPRPTPLAARAVSAPTHTGGFAQACSGATSHTSACSSLSSRVAGCQHSAPWGQLAQVVADARPAPPRPNPNPSRSPPSLFQPPWCR